MANNSIPRRAARFHVRQNNFATYVNGHPADLGLVGGDVVDLNASAATWTTDYPAQTAAQAARQAKDGARDGPEGTIRPLVRRLPLDTPQQAKLANRFAIVAAKRRVASQGSRPARTWTTASGPRWRSPCPTARARPRGGKTWHT